MTHIGGQQPAAPAEGNARLIERIPAKFAVAISIGVFAVGTCLTASSNADGAWGSPSSGSTSSGSFNVQPADSCFTDAESQYTTSWPHDDPTITEAVAKCAVDAVYGNDQWPSARDVIMRESSLEDWQVNSIGACGLGQANPCSKMGKDHSLKAQLDWMLTYIHERYGNPDGADAHEKSDGWY
jgi:hypothetical protein